MPGRIEKCNHAHRLLSKLVADLITASGADRVLTMDLHAGQIQGFFGLPVDHLYASPILTDYVKNKEYKDLVVFSPDAGGVERAPGIRKSTQDRAWYHR